MGVKISGYFLTIDLEIFMVDRKLRNILRN